VILSFDSWLRWTAAVLLALNVFGSDAWAARARSSKPRPIAQAQATSGDMERWEGKLIQSIRFEGLKRIEKDAAQAKLTLQAGKPLTVSAVRTDVKALYAMGYFNEIRVDAETSGNGVDLTFVMVERPAISKIEFVGNERITSSDLRDVIKVKEWEILDINKVRADVALIQKHYEDKGFFLAKVNYEVVPVAAKKGGDSTAPDASVELKYRINDFEKIEIKKITFLNNRRFTDSQLKNVLGETREGGFFSFASGSGNFKESAFKQDLQRLTYWYLDNGYVKFRYDNPTISVSDDKRSLFITIYVEEGEQYTMGTLDFSGDLLFEKDELARDVTLVKDDKFSISKRNADIQKLTEKYQDLGYAFVNVIPKMNIRDEDRIVDLEYSFEKGNLVHFGEFRVLGNTKTHDKVIRRELKIVEGELYNGTRLRQSKENVERLGFFQPGEVIFNSVTPKDRPDVLDVEITIKERSTGTITVGAGYGSVSKFFFTTQVGEINLFGRGQQLSLAAQLAADKRNKSFNLGFTDPYAFDTHWSLGGDVFYTTSSIPGKYSTRKLGFNARMGREIYEYTNAYITYKNEGLRIDETDIEVDPADVAADSGVLSSIVWSVVRDRRNNRFETSDGSYQLASLEAAGLGGDKKFYKWGVNNRIYKRIVGDLVFRNSTEYGQVTSYSGKTVPPSERFYLGGPNSLKGFLPYSIGPTRTRRSSAGTFDVVEPEGGTVQVSSLFELEYPLIREAGVKFVTFYDVGNAFRTLPALNEMVLRSDAGLGIRWFSPIGPLRFEWGFPFKRRPDEDNVVFNFFIGPPF
jgi:outer membrane protein insertion porin family